MTTALAIPSQLDRAHTALARASTDFERIRIRDQSKAVEAAAAILKRRDIQVQASVLVQRAEREIAKANPPKTRTETGRGHKLVLREHEIPQDTIRTVRAVHSKLTDEQFSARVTQAEETETPLTRQSLKILTAVETHQSVAPPVFPEGRYPVLYADPPWRYEHAPAGGKNRSIERQYPTMDLDAICALPVGELATDDAVLFLWATSPKLAEAMRVIEAWGFDYRTNAVWVKDRIGMGYYVRARHELLLIARRGALPVPAPSARPDSVLEAPRAAHSAKPPETYALIERMYPDLPRVEMFSRTAVDGWDSWGYGV